MGMEPADRRHDALDDSVAKEAGSDAIMVFHQGKMYVWRIFKE
jgi:hypothetical protein